MSLKILKTSLGFTFLSLIASALNFAYYPVISHTLSIAEFGDVQVGVSFIMLAASLFTSLNTLALFTAAQNEEKHSVINHVERLVIATSLSGAIIIATFAYPISQILQLSDPSLLYTLAIIFVINIPVATWLGSIQGSGQFIASGWISVASALLKIVSSFAAISLGFGAQGALLGILIGTASALPLIVMVKKQKTINYRQTFSFLRLSDLTFFSKNPAIITILFSLTIFAIVSSLDVLFAKSVLSPEVAGAYAQLSTAAKIPYFVLLPVAIILFERYAKNSLSIQKSAWLYTGLAGFGGAATWILGDFILKVIFDHKSELSDSIFPKLVFSFVIYSILTILIYILIARKMISRLLMGTLSICIIVVAALLLHNSTPQAIAESFTVALALSLLIVLGLQYTKTHD